METMKHNKFSIAEMFSDTATGKTSVTKVSGFFLIVVGAVCFCWCTFAINEIDRINAIIIQALAVLSVGAGLLGIKVFKPAKRPEGENQDQTEEITNNNNNNEQIV